MGNCINEMRLLSADEIECRIAVINEKGLSLLLYKDARVDQKILDETFGMFGWKRSHQSIEGNLYCTVEIRDRETGEWIAKQDVGTTGYAEKEKSQASDSFKRACFNWGLAENIIQPLLSGYQHLRYKYQKGKIDFTVMKDFVLHQLHTTVLVRLQVYRLPVLKVIVSLSGEHRTK